MLNDQALREVHLSLYYKEAGESRAEIGRILGLPASLVKTRLAQVKAALINRQLPHQNLQADFPLEAFELRQEQIATQVTQDQNREANTQARNTIRNEYVQGQLVDAISRLLPPRNIANNRNNERRHNDNRQDNGEKVWVVISDVHVGKHTETFTVEDALASIEKMMLTGLEEAVERDADELVIALLGDILDGYGIYRSQVSEVSLTATEQFTVTLQCIADCLETILSRFPNKITVLGVPGNHGRVSTPETATWENFERLLYETLKLWFRDDDRMNFVVPGRESFYVIYNDVFAFHGHEISGGGTLDGIINRCRQWFSLFGLDWKLSVCGHFHRLMMAHYPQNKIHLANGTATRGDGFIERLGGAHANKMWMFIQNRYNEPTHFIPISLYEE